MNRVLLINLCHDLNSEQTKMVVQSMLTHNEQDNGIVDRDVYISDLIVVSARSDELYETESIRVHFENFEHALNDLADKIHTLFRWGKPSIALYPRYMDSDITSADMIIWVAHKTSDIKEGLKALKKTIEYQDVLSKLDSEENFRYSLVPGENDAKP